MNTDSKQKYPLSIILFHGIIAVLMIAALFLVWSADDNPALMAVHKSVGATVLILGVLRILNRIRSGKRVPRSVNAKGSVQYILEKSVHGLLYVVMLMIPLFGWLFVNANGMAVNVFGLFDLPMIISKNPSIAHTLKEFHELFANVFIGLVVLHVGGAVIHLLKEKSNVFKRMMPF